MAHETHTRHQHRLPIANSVVRIPALQHFSANDSSNGTYHPISGKLDKSEITVVAIIINISKSAGKPAFLSAPVLYSNTSQQHILPFIKESHQSSLRAEHFPAFQHVSLTKDGREGSSTRHASGHPLYSAWSKAWGSEQMPATREIFTQPNIVKLIARLQ